MQEEIIPSLKILEGIKPNTMTRISENPPPEFMNLYSELILKKIDAKTFRLKLYYVFVDDPERWLSHIPFEIIEGDYIITSWEDFDNKIKLKFDENFSTFEFLKSSADELRENKLDTLADFFDKPLFRFYAWFAKHNVNVRDGSKKAQWGIRRHIIEMSAKFRTFMLKEKARRKGDSPNIKFFDLRTGDYDLYGV